MYKKHFYAAVILLPFFALGIQPAFAIITLSDSGWSDPTVGTWDSNTKTATLTTDVADTIQIEISGTSLQDVILDGGGYTVSAVSGPGLDLGGNPPPGPYRVYVTIQNLNVTACGVGINLEGCQHTTIQDVNVTECDTGITLNPSGSCNVLNSTFSDCQYGIFMHNAGTCTIEGNTVSNNDYGIRWQGFGEYGSYNNELINNNIEENNVGLDIHEGVHDNAIYNNNFINNDTQATVLPLADAYNVFDWNGSGNYWSDYTGMDTVEPFGIGDTPYIIKYSSDPLLVVKDNYPLMPTAETKLQELIEKVEDLNGQYNISNALDKKLENALAALTAKNAGQRQDAINKMESFINACEAQSGNQLPEDVAGDLIDAANYIIDLILAEQS